MEILPHIVLHCRRRHNDHIRLLCYAGETCTDDATVLQGKQLWKEQRDHILHSGDIGAALKKWRESHMIEAVKHADILLDYATWQRKQSAQYAALRSTKMLAIWSSQGVEHTARGLWTGEQHDFEAVILLRQGHKQGAHEIGGIAPNTARPRREYLRFDPDSQAACSNQ